PNPFRYVGRFGVMDDGSGLLYMRARYYDPELGRFITKDPIGFVGGVNQYAYVGGNPVNWIDFLGLCKKKSWWESFWEKLASFVSSFIEPVVNPTPIPITSPLLPAAAGSVPSAVYGLKAQRALLEGDIESYRKYYKLAQEYSPPEDVIDAAEP
ncbi:MAG: hypothetical protein DRH12_10460, partial [Deltaproteobacteria bacterium]